MIKMSGATLQKGLVEGLWSHSMSDPSLINTFQDYHNLLLRCYGPNSSSVMVMNSVGRETLPYSSSQLIKEIQFLHPMIKFINALIEAQNKAFGMHGRYVGLLTSGLWVEFKKLEIQGIHRRDIIDIFDWASKRILEYIKNAPDSVLFLIDLCNLQMMHNFVKSTLFSKRFFLTPEEKDHLAICVVKAFLKTIPENGVHSFGKITLKNVGISSLLDCHVYEGLLYPNLEFFNEEKVKNLFKHKKQIKIILFNVPLSFESNDPVQWLNEGTKKDAFVKSLLNKLRPCIKSNISLILCQKIIDPVIRYELEKSGVIALERLGTSLTESICDITNCLPISNLSTINEETINASAGDLSKVELLTIGDCEYLLLSNEQSPCVTITLPDNDDLDENIKININSCFDALRLLVQDPKVVVGAGCFESHLAVYTVQLIQMEEKHIAKELDISVSKVTQVLSKIVKVYSNLALHLSKGNNSILDEAIFEKSSGHIWSINDINADINMPARKCSCCIFSKEDQDISSNFINLNKFVFDYSNINFHGCQQIDKGLLSPDFVCDLFSSKFNATKLVFEGLSQIFDINYCIFDR